MRGCTFPDGGAGAGVKKHLSTAQSERESGRVRKRESQPRPNGQMVEAKQAATTTLSEAP